MRYVRLPIIALALINHHHTTKGITMIYRLIATALAAVAVPTFAAAAGSDPVPPGCVLNEGIPGDPGIPGEPGTPDGLPWADGLDRIDCPASTTTVAVAPTTTVVVVAPVPAAPAPAPQASVGVRLPATR